MKRRALNKLVTSYIESCRPSASAKADIEAVENILVGVAYHEAGHAVVGRHLLGEAPRLASIEQGSDTLDQPTVGSRIAPPPVRHAPSPG